MTISEMIRRYDLRDGANYGKPGKVAAFARAAVIRDGADKTMEMVRAHKDEILAELAARKAAKEAAEAEEAQKRAEMKRMVDAIPGLREIQKAEAAARADMDRWYDEWEQSEHGNYPCRMKPHYDFTAMHERFPAADAYLKAQAVSCKNTAWSHYGEIAMERIARNPDNHVAIVDEMDAAIEKAAMNWAYSH